MLLCCAVLCSLLMKCAVSSSNSCECRVSERRSPAAPRPPFRLSSRPTRRAHLLSSPLHCSSLLSSLFSPSRRVACGASLHLLCQHNSTQDTARRPELRAAPTDGRAGVSDAARREARDLLLLLRRANSLAAQCSPLLFNSIHTPSHPIAPHRIASHRIAKHCIERVPVPSLTD